MTEKPPVKPGSSKVRAVDFLRPEDLANQALFRGIELDKFVGLLDQCQVREVAPDETVIEQGDVRKDCYLILSGSLRVHLGDPASGEITVLGAGESVGEISVLDGKPASAYVIAAQASRLLVVPEDIFWSLVNVSHDFAQRLLYLLASRMRDSNVKLSDSIRSQQEYKRNATLDELTGLHNRRWMQDLATRQIKRCRHDHVPLSLMVIDIDHFKSVNDTYGHLVGDQVIRAVAWTLMNNLRPTDLLARFGGEEFVAVLPDTDLVRAGAAALGMCRAVQQAHVEDDLPATSVSIGVAQLQPGQSLDDLIGAADRAMYQAKNNGRNRVEVDAEAVLPGEV